MKRHVATNNLTEHGTIYVQIEFFHLYYCTLRTYSTPDVPSTDEGAHKNKRKMSESHHHVHVPASISTATPEGEQMLQFLNSLNPMEYSQFEAYRRSTFRGDVISKFVASCLLQIEQERFAQRANAKDFLVVSHQTSGSGAIPFQDQKKDVHPLELRFNVHPPQRFHDGDVENASKIEALQLDPLVEPHAAPEITIAVSSLAKSYAQRLVQASRLVASEQGYDEHAPLLPSHVLEAYRQRSQAGLDPGFFLQPSFYQHSVTWNGGQRRGRPAASCPFICPESDSICRSNRVLKSLATLASQELYDQMMISADTSNITVDDVDASKTQQEETSE